MVRPSHRLIVYGQRTYDLHAPSDEKAELLARIIVKNSHPMANWDLRRVNSYV